MISSYPKVWKLEQKIYSIFNIKLPVAVAPRHALYFVGVLLAVCALGKAAPPVRLVPPVVRYGVVPYLLSNFLLRKKLDGKAPQKYLLGWLIHQMHRGQFVARCQHRIPMKTVKLRWYCRCGGKEG